MKTRAFARERSRVESILEVVRWIPRGKVATYGQVAELAGLPGRARLAGNALRNLDAAGADVPWHRVVNARGEISCSPGREGGDLTQQALLEREGVVFSARGKIDLARFRWEG